MKCRLCVLTTIGRRESNQDRACALTTSIGGIPAVVLAVADGMGGMRDGDRAAEIAIATVRRYADEVFPRSSAELASLKRLLHGMFQEANQAVYGFAQLSSEPGRSGTTLVVCLAFNNQFVVAHAGDSRCYYVNQREIRQLTEDHSKVQDLVRQGSMTAEAARRSPYRNQLLNSVGQDGKIRVDIYSEGDWGVPTNEPFLLLLSSDGLHGELPDEEIFGWVHGTKTIEDAARSLLSAAIQGGSTDNVTVAAVECGLLRRNGPKRRLPLLPEILLAQPQDSNGERLPDGSSHRERIRRRLLMFSWCVLFSLLLVAAYFLWRSKEDTRRGELDSEFVRPILLDIGYRLFNG
jgi:protein phosphatase